MAVLKLDLGLGEKHPPLVVLDPAATLQRAHGALEQAIEEFRDAPRNSFEEGDARWRIREHQRLILTLQGVL